MGVKFDFTIGLIGNPNVGKSTLFNALTGAHQHVGNWPGKTVEKKEGHFDFRDRRIRLVDLPGAYSLAAYTEEEAVTSDFIRKEKPDIIIQIIDAQNLERNLYLTVQLLELGAPLVIALNMVDRAENEGIFINEKEMSRLLNVPVVKIDAKTKEGIGGLLEKSWRQALAKGVCFPEKLTYGREINDELERIKALLRKRDEMGKRERQWTAIKLLEGDWRAVKRVLKKPYFEELKALVKESRAHLRAVGGKDANTMLANMRYGFISGLAREATERRPGPERGGWQERLDRIATNKYFGIPVFLFVAWLIFQLTFKVSEPLTGLLEEMFGFLGREAALVLGALDAPGWLTSLVADGIIGGVGGVLVFTPVIGMLFLLIALMEDTGYMARVAYIMDRFMHRLGLHGKAFIPLMLGFGCNVPAIMATRTLKTKKDRLLTMLITPFMSCGARLPIYALFASVFFSAYQGWVIFSLYLLGIVVAVIVGLIFRKALFKALSSPFVIELPPYRLPSVSGLLIHVWENVWSFIRKAGTIILVFSLIIWFIASVPFSAAYASQDSLAGRIGETVAPVFRPLGFGNWQSSVALIFGFVAKEVVVSTFANLYGAEEGGDDEVGADLSAALENDFTPLSAYAFMVFVLLYLPCIAVLAIIKKETGSWKWPLIVVAYTTAVAWLGGLLVYQGGLLLGFT